MKMIEEILSGEIRTVAIAGHVRPDGDCVGSTTALRNYLIKIRPDLQVDLYLEKADDSLMFLKGAAEAKQEAEEDLTYDLFICCDASDPGRIGVVPELLHTSKTSVCIDHHISNRGFADVNHIEPDASSCSEVLALLLDEDQIDREIAESLYTGMIHDTGVFQYDNTTPRTLMTAAMLLGKGIAFSRIIEESFYERTFVQGRILGYALERAELYFDGRVILSGVTREDLEAYGAELGDLSEIVSQLRLTKGIDAAVFFYQSDENAFKVSFRSTRAVNVSELAVSFGGGGHVQAAGCTIEGSYDEVKKVVLAALRDVLE